MFDMMVDEREGEVAAALSRLARRYFSPKSQPHSTAVRVLLLLLLLLRHAQGNPPISGTKRATGDPLVSKRPDFLGLFSYLRGSHGLNAQRARKTKSRGQKGSPTRSRGPEGPTSIFK